MANLNDFSAKNYARQVLGLTCTVNVKKSYRAFLDGRFAGFLNFGYTTLGKYGVKEVILIGENFPVNKFNAQIIALAHDKAGEKDDILIAARENSIYYEPNIARLTERFIPKDSAEFICYYEKSCGAVLYTEDEGVRKYILITNISGHIGFPKGHIEYGETEKQTALREIYEETGVHTEIIDGFREFYNYKNQQLYPKKSHLFSCFLSSGGCTHEHYGNFGIPASSVPASLGRLKLPPRQADSRKSRRVYQHAPVRCKISLHRSSFFNMHKGVFRNP